MNPDIHHYLALEKKNLEYSKQVMDKYFARLPWSEDDCIADAGCGLGTTTKEILHHLCPEGMMEKIWAFDINRKMIEEARRMNADPRIEYIVADVEDRNSFPWEWREKFSKVTAIFCLHWIQNIEIGLKNIHDILKTDGYLFRALFPVEATVWDVAEELSSRPKWINYCKDVSVGGIPIHRSRFSSSIAIKEILYATGFHIVTFERESVIYRFETIDELKETLRCVGPFYTHIPATLRNEYIEEYTSEMLKRSKGEPEMPSEYAVIIAQKEKSLQKSNELVLHVV